MNRKHIPQRVRQHVRQRAAERCEYCFCWERYATEQFSIEHIIPLVAGGSDDEGNLALACQGCNSAKRDLVNVLDALTDEITPLYHPRKDDWQAHFEWNYNYTLLLGHTPLGRATIEALQLNREGVVNLRKLLAMIGKHPPVQFDSLQTKQETEHLTEGDSLTESD